MCALNKAVKIGGSYYKGFELLVASSAGSYVLDMALDVPCMINSISLTPDVYGAGDTMKLNHMNSGTTASLALLAETVYNPGANVTVAFDFPAFESMAANESLRLTYTNVATKAIAVHTIVEYAGITKTS
jgi:hypothetical protein